MDFYSMVGRTKVAADAYAPGCSWLYTDHRSRTRQHAAWYCGIDYRIFCDSTEDSTYSVIVLSYFVCYHHQKYDTFTAAEA